MEPQLIACADLPGAADQISAPSGSTGPARLCMRAQSGDHQGAAVQVSARGPSGRVPTPFSWPPKRRASCLLISSSLRARPWQTLHPSAGRPTVGRGICRSFCLHAGQKPERPEASRSAEASCRGGKSGRLPRELSLYHSKNVLPMCSHPSCFAPAGEGCVSCPGHVTDTPAHPPPGPLPIISLSA